MSDIGAEVPIVEDPTRELPVPTAWRPVLKDMADALAAGNFALLGVNERVVGVPPARATSIRENVGDYGATLANLPEETWASSVCIWYEAHWSVLVDLWTEEEGRSDLVLQVRVTKAGAGHLFEVHLVYVP